MTGAVLMGGTDLIGLHIIKALLDQPFFTRVDCISYRSPLDIKSTYLTGAAAKLHVHLDFSCSVAEWPAELSRITSAPAIFFSQRSVDYDINLDLANIARKVGVKVYVLTSIRGAEVKDVLQDALRAFGFKTIVVLRPGDSSEILPSEQPMKKTKVLTELADIITLARAAVSAGKQALESDKGTLWELKQSDIVRIGREEWSSSK